jgi:hypothetical protein
VFIPLTVLAWSFAQARVYDVKHSTEVEIYEYRCISILCLHVLRYEGRQDFLFVFSVDIIFTHDLMRSYDYSLQHRASSFSAFVKQHRSQYAEYTDSFVSKRTWIKAFWAWTKYVIAFCLNGTYSLC